MGAKIEVKLLSHFNQGKIHYTLDGNAPTASTVYNAAKPIIVEKNTTVKAQYFEKGKPLGTMLTSEHFIKE
ncbi:MAG: chitobiase/beta-hexosaminidase C-terminal domain-containing protein [Bacteroidetes bacterium]|nr:chitobiase/beta-hexosaminidase C-terminal domain-containing protein [Bacteroidota bacterium]